MWGTKHNWEASTLLEIFVTEYERWEARYATPDYAFGKDPNYFLRSCKSCYRHPVEHWPSQMAKDETGSGWLSRVSTLSRSIFRLQLNEKQKFWQPNGTSRS